MEPQRLTPEQKRLVEKNKDLAHSIALDFWRRAPEEMEKHEVVSVAYLGLSTAAARFDAEHHGEVNEDFDPEKAFGAFVRHRIAGAIMDWQRSRDHVPRRQRRTYKDLQRIGHGNGASLEELSDITGLEVDKIRAITLAVETPAYSLDAHPEIWPGNAQEDGPHLLPTQDVESSAVVSAMQQLLVQTIDSLPRLQQQVVFLHYYAGMDMADISAELGTRLSSVRVAHNEAILIIHSVMRRAAS